MQVSPGLWAVPQFLTLGCVQEDGLQMSFRTFKPHRLSAPVSEHHFPSAQLLRRIRNDQLMTLRSATLMMELPLRSISPVYITTRLIVDCKGTLRLKNVCLGDRDLTESRYGLLAL